jgi:hypothetical protein
MSIERLLHMVDEFGRAMHDSGKRPGSIPPAMLNLERERLHDAIKALAAGKLEDHLTAWSQIDRAAMAAREEPPPVDRDARTLTDGSSVTPGHREIDPASGQQKAYVVLSAEERAKGWVRPYRDAYIHVSCKQPATPPNLTITTMARPIAETYARDPNFYQGTFCRHCRGHHPLAEFRWYEMDGTVGPAVGS